MSRHIKYSSRRVVSVAASEVSNSASTRQGQSLDASAAAMVMVMGQ